MAHNNKLFLLLILLIIYTTNKAQEVPVEPSTPSQELINKHEKKLSEYVLSILEHYKQEDPVGIPGAPIPDPMDIPDLKHSLSIGTMNFKKVKLYGMKNFRIDHVKADIAAMQVEAALTIDTLNVIGNYTLSTWLSKAQGPFTVKLTDVYCSAIAMLEVERSGQLEAQDMQMDIIFKGISMDFKGLGFFATMFQGVINSVGSFIFDSIKPFVLSEVNTNMRNDVNKQVRTIPQRFPNSISPIDQLIADIRHKIRNAKFDPYRVNDYNNSVGIFDIFLTNTWLTGLSSIHRVDDIVFEIRNHSVFATLDAGTQRLEGRSNWEVSLVAGVMSRAGTVSFSVEYIKVEISVSQTMDTTNSPKLEDIQLQLGNIQVRFDGAGTMDYVIEFGINVIPNLLRYQIMDAIEGPVKHRVQEVLNTINIERMVKENADKIDNPQALNFLQ